MVRINWRFVKLCAEAKARLKLRSKVRFSWKLGRCYHRKCKILMEFCGNLFVTRHTCNHWVSSLFLLPEPCLLALWFEPYRWYLEPSKDQKKRIRNKFVASCSCAELVLLKITAWFLRVFEPNSEYLILSCLALLLNEILVILLICFPLIVLLKCLPEVRYMWTCFKVASMLNWDLETTSYLH